jgi:hypothetical protein
MVSKSLLKRLFSELKRMKSLELDLSQRNSAQREVMEQREAIDDLEARDVLPQEVQDLDVREVISRVL